MDYLGATRWNHTFQLPGASYTNQTVIPLTCCRVNESYWPQDVNCPLAPTASNAYLNTSCYDKVYGEYVTPYLWLQWLVYVFVGALIIAPAVLMFLLLKIEDLGWFGIPGV